MPLRQSKPSLVRRETTVGRTGNFDALSTVIATPSISSIGGDAPLFSGLHTSQPSIGPFSLAAGASQTFALAVTLAQLPQSIRLSGGQTARLLGSVQLAPPSVGAGLVVGLPQISYSSTGNSVPQVIPSGRTFGPLTANISVTVFAPATVSGVTLVFLVAVLLSVSP